MNSSRCFWFDSYTKLDSQRLHAWMDFILVSSSSLHFLLLTFNWQMVDWVTFRVLIDYIWWSLAFTERHYKKQDTLLFTTEMLVRKLSPIWSPPEKFFWNSGSGIAYLSLRNLYVFLSTKRISLNVPDCVPFSLFPLVAKKLRDKFLAQH